MNVILQIHIGKMQLKRGISAKRCKCERMSCRIKRKLKLKDKLKLIAIIRKTNDFSKSQQLKLNVSS